MSDGSDLPELPKPPLTAEQEDWLARVDKVAPLILENRAKAERDRVTPDVVFDALRDAGITRMWISKEFGGSQVALETGSSVLRALARLDGSAAWLMGVQGALGRLSDYLPESTAEELYKKNSRLVIGGIKPTGRAEPVDGGYLLSGEWGLASGYSYTEWLMCTAIVTKDGKPVMTPMGPEMRALFIPRSESEMLDTWYTLGMRGTGSEDYRVAETFVPEERTVSRSVMGRAPAARPSRAYGLSYLDFGPLSTAPIALGIAEEALDVFKALADHKTPTSGTMTLTASHTAQEKLGRAESLVYSSRLLLADAERLATALGDPGSDPMSAQIRLAAATIAENTVTAVNLLFNASGSSSLFASSRLEHCFRDIHSVAKHIALSTSHFETVGNYLLGGDLRMRR